MTGYNRMNQRNAIKHAGNDGKRERTEYYPCTECGTMMRTEARARKHCKPLEWRRDG